MVDGYMFPKVGCSFFYICLLLFKDLPIMAFVVLLSLIKLHFQLDKRELCGFN